MTERLHLKSVELCARYFLTGTVVVLVSTATAELATQHLRSQ